MQSCAIADVRINPLAVESEIALGMHFNHEGEASAILDSNTLHHFIESDSVHFLFVHYQLPGFEHYDTVTFQNESWSVSSECYSRIMSRIESSGLAAAVSDGDVSCARRMVLQKLGYGFCDSSSSSSALRNLQKFLLHSTKYFIWPR